MNTQEPLTGRPTEQMQRVLDQLARECAGVPDPTTLPSAEGREVALLTNRRWNRELPAMRSVDTIEFESSGGGDDIEARLFTPYDADKALVVYIHGGGFAFCDIDTHERCTRLLALACGCSVLSIEYRLAPEHPYPAALHDCVDVLHQLDSLREQYPLTLGPMALAGDSSGANLALVSMFYEQQQGRALPDMALLFYGVFDTDFDSPSYQRFAEGPGLTRAKMMRYLDWYVPVSSRNDPLVSPLLADDNVLLTLPPLYFNAAEIDPLCSDTERLWARLQSLGRQDTLHVYPGVVHGFMQMSLQLPAACRAIEDAGRAFRELAAIQSTFDHID